MKKLLFIIPVVLLIAAAGWWWLNQDNDKKTDYKTLTVERGTIVEKALAVGEIAPLNEIQVKSKIAGIVQKIYAEVGDRVRSGERLVDIIPDPTPLEITEARRNMELAKVALEEAVAQNKRQQDLFQQGLISRQDFDRQQMTYKEAQLRMQLNQEKLALLERGYIAEAGNLVESVIKAPIAGTVLEKFVNVGDPVVPLTSFQAGTALFTLANMDQLIFRGTIDEIDVGKVQRGMPAELKIGALPEARVYGEVARISPKAKKQENATLFDIEIAITKAKGAELRAGYSANADIIIKKMEDTLYIPERLVLFENDSTFVEVEVGPNQVERRPIQIGLSDGVNVQVVTGLTEQDQVVERPPKEIK